MTTHPPVRSDPLARYCVYALFALALWAGVKGLTPMAEPTMAQGIIIATPALPTPAIEQPALMLIAPTPEPPTEATIVAPQNMPVEANSSPVDAPEDYIANVGAQAPHAIRDGALEPPADLPTDPPLDALNDPALNGGNVAPEGCPFPIVNGICANGTPARSIDDPQVGQKSTADAADPIHAEPIAVDVPPISLEQRAIIGARTSNTCPAGQVFYPRTGCHAPGSGGPMPGAVGEVQP